MDAVAIASSALRAAYGTEIRRLVREVGQRRLDAPEIGPSATSDILAELHPRTVDRAHVVLAAAEAEWASDVREPPGHGWERIDAYIRGPQGLGWSTADAVNWTPGERYSRNGMFAWCGAFAAFVYGSAGLRSEIRYRHLASTSRLYRWARRTSRWVEPADVRSGDIVVVGPADDRDGAHVTICRHVEPGGAGSVRVEPGISTYEGNAHGFGPAGRDREGVVMQFRPRTADRDREYRIVFGVRPLPEDYV